MANPLPLNRSKLTIASWGEGGPAFLDKARQGFGRVQDAGRRLRRRLVEAHGVVAGTVDFEGGRRRGGW